MWLMLEVMHLGVIHQILTRSIFIIEDFILPGIMATAPVGAGDTEVSMIRFLTHGTVALTGEVAIGVAQWLTATDLTGMLVLVGVMVVSMVLITILTTILTEVIILITAEDTGKIMWPITPEEEVQPMTIPEIMTEETAWFREATGIPPTPEVFAIFAAILPILQNTVELEVM